MSDYRIQIGTELDTKGIDTGINKYHQKKSIEFKSKLDTSGIDNKLASYKAKKPIEVDAKLNTTGLAKKIGEYRPKTPIKLNAKLNTADIDSAVSAYAAKNKKITIGVKLDTKDIQSEIQSYASKTRPVIEVDAKLNDKAIDTAIQNYKPKQRIKVALALNAADIEEKIREYEARSPIRVKVKINKTDINQQLSQYNDADAHITVKAKLDNGAISEAIRNYKAKTPIKVNLELDHTDIDNKVSTYAKSPVEIPVRLKPSEKGFASKIAKTPVSIEATLKNPEDISKAIKSYVDNPVLVSVKLTPAKTGFIDGITKTPIQINAALNPENINTTINKFTPTSKVNVDVKLNPKDINAQIQKLQKPTEAINVGVKLDESKINADIALFKPTATLGIQPDLILENVDDQIRAYVPKAKIKVNVDLNNSDVETEMGKQNTKAPIQVNVKLDRKSINEQLRTFTTKTKVKVDIKLNSKGIAEQIRKIKPKTKIKVGIELDRDDVRQQIQGFKTDAPIRLGVELDESDVLTQIDNIKQRIQGLGNIRIELGARENGNSNSNVVVADGNSNGGSRKQVDEVTQAYRDLIGVLNELNSKRLQLNRLDASSPQSSEKIQRLRLQIEQLDNEYNNLLRSFNAQGIQFTADQWNQLETALAKVGRKIDVVQAGMSDKSVIQSQTQAYKELLSISKEIGSLEINIEKLRLQGGNSNQIEVLENQLRTLQSTYRQLVATMDTPLTNDQWSAIYTQIAQTSEKLARLQAEYADTRAELARDINIRLNEGAFNNDISNITSRFDNLKNKSVATQTAMNEFKAALQRVEDAASKGDDGIDELIKANQDYERALKAVKNQLDINARAEKDAAAGQKLDDSRKAFASNIDAWLTKNSAAAKKFGSQMLDLKAQAKSCDQVTLNHLQNEFKRLDKEAEAAGLKMQTLGDRIKTQFQKYSSYFSVASVFMYASQGLRNMFEQVKLIDSAMTELKKVTNETDASYNKFLSNAAAKSKELGTTIDGLVASTADFARLGYGFEDSQKLAEVANIYAVVGDEIDGVEDATQSLVSTMAAFKNEMNGMDDGDFAMGIVDKMNEVSNNFAISSGGIGEALQRSASSMAAANNTLDETIAMITAANEVAQNPEKVGKWLCRLKKWLYRLNS